MRGQYEAEVEVYKDEKPIHLQRAYLKDGMFGIDGALFAAEELFRSEAANRIVVYISEDDELVDMFEEEELKMIELVEKIRASIEDQERKEHGNGNRNLQTV